MFLWGCYLRLTLSLHTVPATQCHDLCKPNALCTSWKWCSADTFPKACDIIVPTPLPPTSVVMEQQQGPLELPHKKHPKKQSQHQKKKKKKQSNTKPPPQLVMEPLLGDYPDKPDSQYGFVAPVLIVGGGGGGEHYNWRKCESSVFMVGFKIWYDPFAGVYSKSFLL